MAGDLSDPARKFTRLELRGHSFGATRKIKKIFKGGVVEEGRRVDRRDFVSGPHSRKPIVDLFYRHCEIRPGAKKLPPITRLTYSPSSFVSSLFEGGRFWQKFGWIGGK